jgi:hypothetical protein
LKSGRKPDGRTVGLMPASPGLGRWRYRELGNMYMPTAGREVALLYVMAGQGQSEKRDIASSVSVLQDAIGKPPCYALGEAQITCMLISWCYRNDWNKG